MKGEKKMQSVRRVVGALLVGVALASSSGCGGARCTGPNGEKMRAGETVPAKDGCNSCTCDEGGELFCTLVACGVHGDGGPSFGDGGPDAGPSDAQGG